MKLDNQKDFKVGLTTAPHNYSYIDQTLKNYPIARKTDIQFNRYLNYDKSPEQWQWTS